jgi:FkbM family methyltransferase
LNTVFDDALTRAFGSGKAIRLIQIGGNDGVFEDPIYPHHVAGKFGFEWAQIYEPLPEYFDRLRENMATFPYVRCHKLAVDAGQERQTREFSYVPLSSVERFNLPRSSQGLGSFSRDRNALGGFGYTEVKFNAIKNHIRTIEVQAIPIREVLADFGDANLLVTDCEGYDIEIIAAAFEHEDFRPCVVQFEYLGKNDDLFRATVQRLKSIGYVVTKVGKNLICEHG